MRVSEGDWQLPSSVDVTDPQGRRLGWVMWDDFGEFVEVENVRMPVEFLLRLPGDADQPRLQIKFEMVDDRPQCRSLHLDAKPRGREVAAIDVDVIHRKLAQWTEVTVKAVMHEQRKGAERFVIRADFVSPDQASKAFTAIDKKPKRRKMTPRFLAEVADLYREYFDENPWKVIADHYTVTEATAARYVVASRKAGYLPKTTPGRKKALDDG